MSRPASPEITRDIITIGASAGGVPALKQLFAEIAPGFAATMFVVLHRSPFHEDHLTAVLRGRTNHTVMEAEDRGKIEKGSIYLAPRDLHLVLEPTQMRLFRNPKEHYTRPAIDPLFRSAASAFGSRVVGVLLTGMGQDGLGGMVAIKKAGGLALVQDPADAEFETMPRRAIEGDSPDAVLKLDALAEKLRSLIGRSG